MLDGAIPLHVRIATSVRNKILSGQYEPGHRLPSEERMAKEFGVSRVTVRAALSHLDEEGLIIRKRGRGTSVSEEVPRSPDPVYHSLSEIVEGVQDSKLKPIDIKRMKISETRIAAELASFFNMSPQDELARIRRILKLDNAPIHYFENFMPLEVAKHVTKREISEKKAIIRVLKDNIGIKIGRGDMHFQVVPAEEDVAEILESRPFDLLMRIKARFWFDNGEPFEIVNYFMRAEHFQYKVDIDATDFA
jgi:GntR family transcriptional regulator